MSQPPEPTTLRILRGNPGKRAINDKEPKAHLIQGDAKAPAWLPVAARKHWRRIAPIVQDLQVLTEADRDAAAAMANELTVYAEMHRILAKEGRTYVLTTKTGDSMVMVRPEVHIANSAFTNFVKLTDRFGMNPSYRSKLRVEAEKETDPLEELRNRGSRGTA